MIGIVVSRADSASTHIGEHLLAGADWSAHDDPDRADSDGGGTYYRTDGFELRTFETMHVDLDSPAAAFSTPEAIDCLVFVSRHAGETGPLLTAHVTGNFGPADYGGEPRSFARAAPGVQKAVVAALAEHAPADYDVGIECTHHGPTGLSVPSLFVELGSDEAQWEDPVGARAVAKAVLELRGVDADHRVRPEEPPRHVVGFGGGHYTPRCTRLVTDSAWAVGHIGSEWQLEAMGDPAENRAVIDAAFEASAAALAVVDGDRPALTSTIEDLGYRVVSETWLRTVGRRPLSVVAAAEATLSPVSAGLRFGEAHLAERDEIVVDDAIIEDDGATGNDEFDAREAVDATDAADAADATDAADAADATDAFADRWFVVELPDELLASAAALDDEAVWNTVAERTVAFETTEGATLPAGRALVLDATAFDRLVDRLASLLESRYETVERRPAELVCRDRGFDPAKAATLGVPEGPKFGRLAAGEAVVVDGRTIEPHAVESDRVERFRIDSPEPVADGEIESDRCQTNGKHK